MEIRKRVKLRIQPAKKGSTYIYVMTLPREFIEALGWSKGDTLEVALIPEKGELRVRRVKP